MFQHLSPTLSGAEQLQFLEQIATAYPDERVLLVWDNGPTHRNKRVAAWLEPHPWIVCFWLPPYSGADVNPIEHCWRWLRDHVMHNHLFQTLEELTAAAREFFRDVASNSQQVLARLRQM